RTEHAAAGEIGSHHHEARGTEQEPTERRREVLAGERERRRVLERAERRAPRVGSRGSGRGGRAEFRSHGAQRTIRQAICQGFFLNNMFILTKRLIRLRFCSWLRLRQRSCSAPGWATPNAGCWSRSSAGGWRRLPSWRAAFGWRPPRCASICRRSPAAEPLFLRREGELLRELVRYLERRGQGALVDDFLRERVAAEREAALARVRGLAGEARLAAAARILSESGFMAEVVRGADGAAMLRLCHCPIRNLVAATRAPCRLEIALAEELA